MQLSEATFIGLIAGLYEAGLGRKDWAETIRSVATAFGAVGGVVFDLEPGSGQISIWTGPGLETGTDDYSRFAITLNSYISLSPTRSQGAAGRRQQCAYRDRVSRRP